MLYSGSTAHSRIECLYITMMMMLLSGEILLLELDKVS